MPEESLSPENDHRRFVATFAGTTVTHTGTQRDGTRFSQVWKTIDSLGSGTYGDVVLQELQGSPGDRRLRAVKSITKKAHKNNKKILTNELKALIAVKKHPTKFVTFHGWYQDPQQTMFIAMEYVSGGSLEKYMRKLKRVEVKEICREVTAQLLEALVELQRKQIAHRDLKPSNILISSTSPLLVKICDFGIAKSADIDASGLKTYAGTVKYMAPEIQGYLPTEKYESRGTYTIAVDMWSLGMVCHELHTGSVPFWKTADEMDDDNDDDDISGLFRSSLSLKDQETRYETAYTSVKTHLDQSKTGYETAHTSVKIYLDRTEFQRYCNGSAFPDKLLNKSGVSEDAKEFILSLLEVDPMERPYAQRALRHRWITGGGSAANRSLQQSRSSSQCNTPQPPRLSVTSPPVNHNKQQQPPNPGVNGSCNPQRISSPHNCNTSASPSGSAQRRRHADNYPPRSSYNPNGYASSSLNPNGYQLPGPNTHGHVPPQSEPNPNGYLYQSPDPNSGGYPLSSPDLNVYQSPGYSPNGYQDSVHNTNSLQPSNGMMSYGGQPHQNMGPAPGEGNPYFSQPPIYTQQGMPSQQPAGYEGPPRGYEGPMHPGAMIGGPCSCPECYESDSSSDDNGMHFMPMPGGMGPPAMVPTMVGPPPSGVITYYWT